MKELIVKIVNRTEKSEFETEILLEYLEIVSRKTEIYYYGKVRDVIIELNGRDEEIPIQVAIDLFKLIEDNWYAIHLLKNLIIHAEKEENIKLRKIWGILKEQPEFKENKVLQQRFFEDAILNYEIVGLDVPLKWSYFRDINKIIRAKKLKGLNSLFLKKE